MMLTEKTKDRLEKTGLALCFAGLFAILQPFSILLYQYGFQILCIGGFMYVALGYVPANVRIPKAVVLVLSVLGVVVGFLVLGIVLAPMLVG
jgi:hypothetical protein